MSMYNSCFSEPKRSHAVPGDDQARYDQPEEEPAGAPDPDGPAEEEAWGLWTGDLTNWGRRAFFVDRLKMNARIYLSISKYLDR